MHRALVPLLLLAVGCAGHPLTGAWELVDETRAPGKRPVKILSESHFAFGSTGRDGKPWSGGGTWSLQGGTYTETPRYHSVASLVGRTLVFTMRLEGDLWHHDGSFTVDGRHFEIHEVWRRLPAGSRGAREIDSRRERRFSDSARRGSPGAPDRDGPGTGLGRAPEPR